MADKKRFVINLLLFYANIFVAANTISLCFSIKQQPTKVFVPAGLTKVTSTVVMLFSVPSLRDGTQVINSNLFKQLFINLASVSA